MCRVYRICKASACAGKTQKGKEEEKVVSTLILRTLKVARYESENKGHFGIEWLLNLIKKVAELAVSALQDFFSHILVKKLSLSISVAGDDAADTAIKYGKCCAVVYPAVGTIVRVVKCKGYGVDINPNFSEKAETEINFDFAARIFAFRLIGLAVKHGIKGIKLLAEVKND